MPKKKSGAKGVAKSFGARLESWGLTSLRIKAGPLRAEFKPQDPDKSAAWSLYVELLTRITTQPLPPDHGDEKTALDSVFSLFATTRTILKENRGCTTFSKVAVPVLNQIIRPFTAEWHKLSLEGAFDDKAQCQKFRDELSSLQKELRKYTTALADIAGVEDLTKLEDNK